MVGLVRPVDDAQRARTAPEKRLIVQLLPALSGTELLSRSTPPAQKTAQKTVQKTALGLNRVKQTAARLGQISQPATSTGTGLADSPAAAPQTEPKAPAADTAQAARTAQTSQPLQLGLGRKALDADRKARLQPLASAVDASQAQSAPSKVARAFAPLAAPSSTIVEETMLADGGRMVRFSGGGCMKMQNPAARSYDDIRKPAMTSC